ncbi:hypothetical protein H3V53_35610 [Paraburkholderia bengalensis]|uniref:Uncharacterized protein n=1 Tax=Paraburkholderia bengalensis TaxID=2747562 RepID=A0ABU8J3H6_9BURK
MVTPSKFNRTTAHLGEHAGAFADACFQAVEDLFEGAWLRKDKGHRLQTLWARRDILATNELYALGKAIRNLQPKHAKWLESTARRLKKNPADSHGLITEILVCGSTRGHGGAEVYPSKKDEPGVDLVVRFPSSFKYVMSVKNHDISIHEKAFQKLAEGLKEAFVSKLKKLGENGKLYVVCDDYMSADEFTMCIDFVRGSLRDDGAYVLIPNRLTVFYAKLVNEPDREFAKTMTSSAVLIHCGEHPNEQLNFKDKLRKAAENMQKHVARSDTCFRLLRMRVHASADIIALEKAAQDMLDANTDCGLDGVLLTQSTGAREKATNNTIIYTVVRFAGRTDHAGLVASVQRGERLSYEFGVGSIGQTPAETFFSIGNHGPTALPRGRYVYQKTDYYYLMKRDANGLYGNLESPASGVHFHAVAELNGTEVAIQAISPASEDVLIV